MNRVFKILALFLITFILSGGINTSCDEQAKTLLQKYGYHITSCYKSVNIKLGDGKASERYYDTSKAIGYDLEKYKDEQLTIRCYKLKEMSDKFAPAYACILFNKRNQLVGANIAYYGYFGFSSLNDKTNLAKNELLEYPDRLNGGW